MPESISKTCPKIGDLFPEMMVQTTQGEIHLPQDYQGNWFVWWFCYKPLENHKYPI